MLHGRLQTRTRCRQGTARSELWATLARSLPGFEKALTLRPGSRWLPTQLNISWFGSLCCKLTRLEVVHSTAQPLTYNTVFTEYPATPSDPIAALLHMPDDIREWVGVEEGAIAFAARIPESEPIFDGWSGCNVNPSHELTMWDCMDSTFFKLANQLGGTGGLAAINFSTMSTGLGLTNNPDKAWTWGSCTPRVVASGTVPTASGARRPFVALDLLPSRRHPPTRLQPVRGSVCVIDEASEAGPAAVEHVLPRYSSQSGGFSPLVFTGSLLGADACGHFVIKALPS
ncbi:hypothetical protein WJX72_001489 [[Myrmecia] bisecta]|uniref:Uncharacterized protein n=1 Tax=[Myrmecia] bisecta TaxID=41462 RepID=A0AAW1P4N4_9CHLO